MKNIFERPDEPKEKKYTPPATNRHIGAQKTTGEFKDAYTIKQEAENLEKDYENRDNFYIDTDGQKTPISQLNGQTKRLLKETREAIQKEAAANKKMKRAEPTGTEEDTPEAAKNEASAQKNKKYNRNKDPRLVHSIDKFYSNHGRHLSGENAGERIGTKLGLYKDYNPKLNAGAPGNRVEQYRQARQTAEKTKGLQPQEEPIFEDDLPDLKDEA